MQEISLNILDMAQNSVAAGATLVEIDVEENPAADTLLVRIRDNGRGMDKAQLARVTDPFYTTRTTRKVGLGVPLFKMAAEMAGGSFTITSKPGRGTEAVATFGLSNIDRMPLGDMASTILALIAGSPDIDFVYRRRRGMANFTLDTREVRKIMAGLPANAPEVTAFLREFLIENEKELSNTPPGTARTQRHPN